MAHARGVIVLAAAQRGVPVFGYAAARIKKTLTGSGKAPKEQMQHAIQTELGLDRLPEPHDVADACAVALCHFQIAAEPPGRRGLLIARRSARPAATDRDPERVERRAFAVVDDGLNVVGDGATFAGEEPTARKKAGVSAISRSTAASREGVDVGPRRASSSARSLDWPAADGGPGRKPRRRRHGSDGHRAGTGAASV